MSAALRTLQGPSPTLPEGLTRHPCFHAPAAGRYGRIHLPVASGCNIGCGYCDRKHDCANESRPGVSSRLLRPQDAVAYLRDALRRLPSISVVGVAGPGDPFAAPEATLETLRRVRAAFPDLLLCVATNGLGLAPHAEALARLGATCATVTVNAVDPDVGARIYTHALVDGKRLTGRAAAAALIERQLDAVTRLTRLGLTVKVNTVIAPGLNHEHAPAVAAAVAERGAALMNCLGLIPVPGTPLGRTPAPTPALLNAVRDLAGRFLPQMRHCGRCRADAAGLIAEGAACAQ